MNCKQFLLANLSTIESHLCNEPKADISSYSSTSNYPHEQRSKRNNISRINSNSHRANLWDLHVLLTVKAPPFSGKICRPSVDVVVFLDIGGEINAGKLNSLKRSMKGMIFSLSSNDRLLMVAFSYKMLKSYKIVKRRIIYIHYINGRSRCEEWK